MNEKIFTLLNGFFSSVNLNLNLLIFFTYMIKLSEYFLNKGETTMDSLSGIITLLIIFSPIILLMRRILKSDQNKKKSKEIFNSIVKERNITVTKDFFIFLTKKQYQYLLGDDTNKKFYYMSLDKKKLSNLNIKELNYTDIIRCGLIHNGHSETIDSLGSLRDRRIEQKFIDSQGLRIGTKNIASPNLDIYFLDSKSSISLSSQIEEWITIFEIIIAESNKAS